ncbi:hypothetical protein AXG93_4510s1280 [Marchantia polymorpha subsp. ruderalis]|uniref:Chalcone/stilbene synthase N-terminal domain-containing protein n=1 Tax=Marchantia polymorpha subsp. ruderalis TaxID=1480154 RepID=A0A176WG84_MARPO|nr:hypothetical protein AXG93_4510s1280 [Marchantia polymorpha subsp. ruderalis]
MANNGNVSYRHQRAVGPATVLAIGKATPPTAYPQSEYPDFFFDVTNTNHKTDLKAKFARICKNSGINKRRSAEKKSSTTGEGCEWGLVVGFGPGLTVEVSVLRAIATGH